MRFRNKSRRRAHKQVIKSRPSRNLVKAVYTSTFLLVAKDIRRKNSNSPGRQKSSPAHGHESEPPPPFLGISYRHFLLCSRSPNRPIPPHPTPGPTDRPGNGAGDFPAGGKEEEGGIGRKSGQNMRAGWLGSAFQGEKGGESLKCAIFFVLLLL